MANSDRLGTAGNFDGDDLCRRGARNSVSCRDSSNNCARRRHDEEVDVPTEVFRLRPDDARYLAVHAAAEMPSRVEEALRTLLAISEATSVLRKEEDLEHRFLDLLFEAVHADAGAVLRVVTLQAELCLT